jgi:hypothetical protein
MPSQSLGRYIAIVLTVTVVVAIAVSFAYVLRGLTCSRSGYGDNTFMAYCNVAGFEDYEHGAFYYPLEPKAVEALTKAEVVFLGNSKALFAFSVDAVRDFFTQRKLPYYVFAFGSNQVSDFPYRIMTRNGSKPRVMVVNADPFFFAQSRASGVHVIYGGLGMRITYMVRKAFQSIHKPICQVIPTICGTSTPVTFFRRIDDGRWLLSDEVISARAQPIDLGRTKPLDLTGVADIASLFIDTIGTRRDCVVLTGVPEPEGASSAAAAELARQLGVVNIQPDVGALSTWDGLHLNVDSGTRFSKAFLAELEPVLQRCL